MHNALRWTLRASAAYDLLALTLLVAMPRWLFEFFSHPIPTEPFLFRLAALPLWMTPIVYLMASRDPSRTPELVRACVALRLIGGAGIAALLLWHRPPGAMAYWSFAIGDLLWALAIEGLRRRARVGVGAET